jgi:hypothetical protein
VNPLRISRRQWLGAGALALVVATPLRTLLGIDLTRLAHARGGSAEAMAARLTRLFRSPRLARRIGRAYLWGRASSRTLDQLVASIVPPSEQNAALDAEQWELRRYLRDVVEDDFAAVRVVSIGGWMLAEAEAEACALAVGLADR